MKSSSQRISTGTAVIKPAGFPRYWIIMEIPAIPDKDRIFNDSIRPCLDLIARISFKFGTFYGDRPDPAMIQQIQPV